MITYLALFFLGIFVLYKLSSSFSGALVSMFTGSSNNSQTDIQELFFRTVFTLLGYVAKRDGPINQHEVKRTETYMEKMELDADHKREAIRLFKAGAQPEFKIDKTIDQFKWLAQKSPNLVQILLVYLINLARVDGSLVNKEIEAVQRVALGLGYSDLTFTHLLKMVAAQNNFNPKVSNPSQKQTNKPAPQTKSKTEDSADLTNKSCEEQTKDFNNRPDQLENAYAVFGLSLNATEIEIKKAYRSLVNQYHPDKLVSLGLPSYMMQSVTECFQRIQAAYDYIKAARK